MKYLYAIGRLLEGFIYRQVQLFQLFLVFEPSRLPLVVFNGDDLNSNPLLLAYPWLSNSLAANFCGRDLGG